MFLLSQSYSSLLSTTKNLLRIDKSIDYLLIRLIDHRSRFFSSSNYLTCQLNCLDKHFSGGKVKYILLPYLFNCLVVNQGKLITLKPLSKNIGCKNTLIKGNVAGNFGFKWPKCENIFLFYK